MSPRRQITRDYVEAYTGHNLKDNKSESEKEMLDMLTTEDLRTILTAMAEESKERQ